ncbi:hypothetical protein ASA1KI_21130 [Opitutales bacterium ASA1]|uniref:phage minor head protein n=1 Tax=Congregicoccus parvus TaxID=3081749 RepID=UPI002B31D10F|nr:hypothetical protein ASA1KI_21130 [Opitutales bacterium ASA1]
MAALLLDPVPHDEAIAFLRDKPAVSRAVFDRLIPELQARAFVVTGIENLNLLQNLREKIAELPAGADWDELRATLAAELSPWLGGEVAAERRAELLLRWHGNQAYAASQYAVLARQVDVFPFWRYESQDDPRVRPAHARLDGLIFPADHPFWQTHFPPWEWGCRCRVVALTQDDVDEIRAREAAFPPEARTIVEGERADRAANEGVLEIARPVPGAPAAPQSGSRTVGPSDRGGAAAPPRRYGPPERLDVRAPQQRGRAGPAWRPGDLHLAAEDLRPRYDPEAWRVFEEWARRQPLDGRTVGRSDSRTVWEWMNRAPARPAPGAPAALPSGSRTVGPSDLGRGAPPQPTPPASLPPLASLPTAEARTRIGSTAWDRERNLGGGVNTTSILSRSGTDDKVVFKPAAGEARDVLRPGVVPGTQWRREIAASIVDEELGLGLVPPTAALTHGGLEGSAQVFREGFVTAIEAIASGALPPRARSAWAQFTKRQRQDWQLLDEVLAHTDRHAGNWMVRPRAGGGWDIALIDNGLSLATKAYTHFRALPAGGQALDAVSRRKLAAFLARETEIRARLAALVEPAALDHLFTRARALLNSGRFSAA